MFQICFSAEIASKQASSKTCQLCLSSKKKKLLATGGRRGGGDRLWESFLTVSSYVEGSAYAYAHAYVCKRARLLEQM